MGASQGSEGQLPTKELSISPDASASTPTKPKKLIGGRPNAAIRSIVSSRFSHGRPKEVIEPSPEPPLDEQNRRELQTEDQKAQLVADEGTDLKGKFLVSNESNLHVTFEPLREHAIPGVGIYVGFDRGLDAMANIPQLEQMYILDYDRTTSLTTLAVLEVAKRHIVQGGEFTDIEQFLRYFDPEQMPQTMELLAGAFEPADQQIIEGALNRTFRQHDRSNEKPDADNLLVDTYLRDKHSQDVYTSWVSNPDALNKIVRAYMEGRINVANVNLGGSTANSGMAEVARRIETRGLPISVIDISNVLSAGASEEVLHGIHQNFGASPAPEDYPVKLPIQDTTLSVYSDSLIPRPRVGGATFKSQALRAISVAGMGFGYLIQNVRDWRSQVAQFGEDTWAVNTRIRQQQGITTTPSGVSLAIES